MAKLLRVLVAPHIDAQRTAIWCCLGLQALSWCAQFAARQHRHDAQPTRFSLRRPVRRMDVANMLVFWVIAVCARGGDVDLRALLCGRRLGASGTRRLEDKREALTGRR